jgi:ribonuclease VapC
MRASQRASIKGKRREPKRYVLDTSAVIAYLADEAGAQEVTALLRRAERGRIELLLSFMSLMELEYNAMRRGGQELATDVLMKVQALPLTLSFANDLPLLQQAARLKASHALSVADAWIAALALTAQATLVHKDPEFEALGSAVAALPLPSKSVGEAPPSSRQRPQPM